MSNATLPTVAEVLAFDVLRQGRCRLVAGIGGVQAFVRWVHVSELADIGPLLKGGELILTTGVALPEEESALAQYVLDLRAAGAVGLVVELGRKYHRQLPRPLLVAADSCGLPLAVLEREVAFVAVTEAVHSRIVDVHLQDLRRSEQIHAAFTELSLEQPSEDEVLELVARLSGRPVILENIAHDVITFDPAGLDPAKVLSDWEDRSRKIGFDDRLAYDADLELLVGQVVARGKVYGRLILDCDVAPSPWHLTLMERAINTLALTWLIARDQARDRGYIEQSLLTSILDRSSSAAELGARLKTLGIPLDGHRLVGLTALLHVDGPIGLRNVKALRILRESIARLGRELGVHVITGVLRDAEVTGLLSLPGHASLLDIFSAIGRAALASFPDGDVTIGIGAPGLNPLEARYSLEESRQVAYTALALPSRPFFQLEDLGIRGLLSMLGDDARLHTFTERQLGGVLSSDKTQRDYNLQFLRAYFGTSGNVQEAARRMNMSRSAIYQRLRTIEETLNVDLRDSEQSLALQLAVIALDQTRDRQMIGELFDRRRPENPDKGGF